MRSLGRIFLASLLLLAFSLAAPAANVAGAPPRITVLVSHDGAQYRDALRGFQQALAQSGASDAAMDVHVLDGDGTKALPALQQARRDGAALVFAIGALATQAALAESREMPLVAGLILNADSLQRSGNAAGVVLDSPPEVQLDWIKRLLPEARTVGVLFNPLENRQRIEAAARAAQAKGLKLVAREVDTPEALPGALDSLAKRVDVLWGIVDPVVLSPETAQAVLLFSFRNGIPFIGLSSAWVKAGAIYALDWDYEDIGKQCAELAQKILKGAHAGNLPPVTPRKLSYSINLRTARHMKVGISESLVRGAAQVFE